MAVTIHIFDGPVPRDWAQTECQVNGHGAEAEFLGVVRDLNQGRTVKAVDYDCHKALTKKVFEDIAEEALSKCEANIRISHGTGLIQVGEASVAIRVGTPHRSEAFELCRFIIEQIKVRAPIWKQEHYTDGMSEWVKGHSLCGHSSGGGSLEKDGHEQGASYY